MTDRYAPGNVPAEYSAPFFEEELAKIRAVLDQLEHGKVYSAAPDKVWQGLLVEFDTNYDPGSGAGLYVYMAAGWKKITVT